MKKITYFILSAFAVGTVACSKAPVNPEIKVMTYNIRYDNPDDSLNNWKYRKDVAAKAIHNCNVDILGAQEVLVNQLNDLKQRLPDYTALGVGRDDGKQAGEYSALFYKTSRFTPVRTGYFWLSQTPDSIGSKGWDGGCKRIATWALLQDKKLKKDFFVMNTHLDNVGVVARRESVDLLLNRAVQYSKGNPIIVTGDFNASPNSGVIDSMQSVHKLNRLIDSKNIAKVIEGDQWSFHDFGKIPVEKRERIDYIFVNSKVQVDSIKTLPEKLNGIFLSDHVPVVAKLTLK